MKRLATFGALLAWCMALIALRVTRSNSVLFFFLIWNLFLAAVPFFAALTMEALERRRSHLAAQSGVFAIWLLFLPNAPYILTDLIHLKPRPPIPIWFDTLMLLSCAGTGLLLGYGSMLIVQRIIERRFGLVTGWIVAVVAMVLSAFGMYLGRFERWNSWQALTEPRPLLADIVRRVMNPLDHPTTVAVTVLFGVALTLGYVALHVLAEDV
ncbi:MAG TPA: DUF1361 domain-containing protein [Thermoanaerobaculia bacterium]|nr:DUF1361 domain-containing protein [Thermoanaerobaculia bacterium]